MSEIPKNHKIILDSGPLLIALSINYSIEKKIENRVDFLKPAYNKIKNLRDISKLEEFFSNIFCYYTTPHVIGELTGLIKSRLKMKEKEREFWDFSIKYLARKNLTEYLISLLDLSRDSIISPLINKIGFIDSELIKLAIDLKIPIVSIDRRTLAKAADEKNIEVCLLEDILFSS